MQNAIWSDELIIAQPEPVVTGTRTTDSAEHVVMFYDHERFLLDSLVGFIAPALQAGRRGVVVATPEHRAGLDARLSAQGIDVGEALASGRYVAADARETLARFMIDDWPSPERFDLVLDELLDRCSDARSARIFGEMVALLADDGFHDAALELEALWNWARATRSFDLLCAYRMATFRGPARERALKAACDAHSCVVPCESYSGLTTPEDRLREIAALQQKAASLECALAAEREARDAAEGALRARDEFLSTASHELRTPITVVGVQTQMLLRRWERNGELETDRAVRALRSIASQTDKVAQLVAQLLDVSRLDAGRLHIEPAPTNIAALVCEVAGLCQSLSEDHPISVSAPEEVVASVDPLRLEQVLMNLLDNAMKYTDAGTGIDVDVRRVDPERAEVCVRDHGPGIPSEKLEHIFDRFFQAAPESGRGLGLGLYLCRTIVELHGGELTAECPSDGGTRFCIRLRG